MRMNIVYTKTILAHPFAFFHKKVFIKMHKLANNAVFYFNSIVIRNNQNKQLNHLTTNPVHDSHKGSLNLDAAVSPIYMIHNANIGADNITWWLFSQ